MDKQGQIPALATKENIIAMAIIFIIGLSMWGSYHFYFRKKEKNVVVNYIRDGYNAFVSDSFRKNIDTEVIYRAIVLAKYYPKTKEAVVINDWLKSRNIDTSHFKIQYEADAKKLRDSMFSGFANDRYGPDHDELHYKAFIIAQDFIRNHIKAPPTADFRGDFLWRKAGLDDTYLIMSTVHVQDSIGAMLRKKWQVKLKYNGGNWTDISNWTLIDVSIQQ